MGVSKTKDSVTGPLHLALDITNKCNYRCLHCYNASGENCVVNNELTDEEVLELINQISKIKPHTFCFCGGEPLLRKDLIVNCSEILYRNGVSAISAVSNGYYLTEEIADELVQAHVSGIQISLDGFSKNSCFELRQNVRTRFQSVWLFAPQNSILESLKPFIIFVKLMVYVNCESNH